MQNRSSFNGGLVSAQSASPLRLGGGLYSLSSRSSVPYVSFEGPNGFQKTITWGEVAEIPCDATATVWNASFHAGQVIINAGVEPDPKPARVTVPLSWVVPPGEFAAPPFTQFIDTRRAVRAYLAASFQEGYDLGLSIFGVSTTDFPTGNMLAGTDGPGFAQGYTFEPGTTPGLIPLGYRAGIGDSSRPHALLDKAKVTMVSDQPTPQLTLAVLEY